MDLDTLPDDLRVTVADELAADERVIWCGRPDPRRMLWVSWGIVLFGIPWTAFAVFWMVMAADVVAGGLGWLGACFPLFGVPFILIGVGLLSAPYWVRRSAVQTVYAVTDRRAIIFQGGLSFFKQLTVRSFPPAELQSITRTQRPDGSGDLVLHERRYRDSDGDRQSLRIGFFGIPDVKRVECLIRDLAAKKDL